MSSSLLIFKTNDDKSQHLTLVNASDDQLLLEEIPESYHQSLMKIIFKSLDLPNTHPNRRFLFDLVLHQLSSTGLVCDIVIPQELLFSHFSSLLVNY